MTTAAAVVVVALRSLRFRRKLNESSPHNMTWLLLNPNTAIAIAKASWDYNLDLFNEKLYLFRCRIILFTDNTNFSDKQQMLSLKLLYH